MRGTRVLTLITLLALAAPAWGQDETIELPMTPVKEPPMPRWTVGLGGGLGQPVGELSDHLDSNFQFDVSGFRLFDPARQWGLRIDGAFLNHSSIKTRVEVPGTTVDLTTNNSIFTFTGGPQLMFGSWPLKAYVHAGIGVTWFSTETTAGDAGDDPATTNFESSRLALEGGGALLWRPWKALYYLELGARYLQNGHARFVTREGVEISGNTLFLTPIESDANLVLYRLNVTRGFETWNMNY